MLDIFAAIDVRGQMEMEEIDVGPEGKEKVAVEKKGSEFREGAGDERIDI